MTCWSILIHRTNSIESTKVELITNLIHLSSIVSCEVQCEVRGCEDISCVVHEVNVTISHALYMKWVKQGYKYKVADKSVFTFYYNCVE